MSGGRRYRRPPVNGKVLTGDNLRDSICWKGATSTKRLKVYYEANLFSTQAVV
jgi:hypothetical protein